MRNGGVSDGSGDWQCRSLVCSRHHLTLPDVRGGSPPGASPIPSRARPSSGQAWQRLSFARTLGRTGCPAQAQLLQLGLGACWGQGEDTAGFADTRRGQLPGLSLRTISSVLN